MRTHSEEDYRTSHASEGYGVRYNKNYSNGYYFSQWQLIEKPLLVKVLNEAFDADSQLLDFACGTGRITRLISEHFRGVTGVDVSRAMLSEASVASDVKLLELDLTKESLPERFDGILAFRFLLNADHQLQRDALKSIKEHLKENGVFVCNVHMSATSPMGLVYRGLNSLTGRTIHKTMSAGQLKAILESSGFTVEKIIHYSFLPRPGRYFPAICNRLILPFERFCKAVNMPSRLSQSFIAVARS